MFRASHLLTVISRWLLTLLLGGVAVVLMFELLGRWFLGGPLPLRNVDRLGQVGRPGALVVHSTEGFSRFRLNSEGLADGEIDSTVTHRWLLFGDSFSRALQLGLDSNYSAIVERRLGDLELVNTSLSGTSPASVPAILDAFGHLADDGIVLQVSDHDVVQLFQPHRIHLRPRPDGSFEEIPARNTASWSRLGGIRYRWMQRSAFVNLLTDRLNDLERRERTRLRQKFSGPTASASSASEDGDAPESDNPASDAYPVSSAAMDFILEEIQARVPRVIVVYIPHLEYSVDGCEIPKPDRQKFWRDWSARHEIPFVDPTDAFCELYLRDHRVAHGFSNTKPSFGHLNRDGHRILAGLLADAMSESIQ